VGAIALRSDDGLLNALQCGFVTCHGISFESKCELLI